MHDSFPGVLREHMVCMSFSKRVRNMNGMRSERREFEDIKRVVAKAIPLKPFDTMDPILAASKRKH